MLSIYLFCAIVGGVLMLLSFFSGHLDGDGFPDLDGDGFPDLDTDSTSLLDFLHLDTDSTSFLSDLPFLSLRFWVYGGGMFGLTGLILTFTGKPFLTTLIGALLTGVTTGWSIAWIFQQLKRRTPNSLITSDDLIGATGTIELPCDPTQPGKVRLTLKGQQVEYPARTRNPTPLPLGETIIVVDVQGQWVEVVPQGVDKSETNLLD